MKTLSQTLFTIVIAAASFAAHADSVTCVRNASGFSVANADTGAIINPDSHYFELYTCEEAAKTAFVGLVCASAGSGTAVYRIADGARVGDDAFYFDVATCATALSHWYNGVVCLPRSTGSGIYDLARNQFVGDGFYFDVNDCTWAASSAAKSDTEVCTPRDGYTAIYSREFNAQSRAGLFATSQQCAQSL